MDTRTPMLVLLGLLLTAVAFSVLGLAADNLSFYNKNHDKAIDIHYIRWNSTAEAQYSYWLKLDYAPSQMSMSREQAELMTSLFCALIGAGIAVGSWVFRGQKAPASGSSLKNRLTAFLPIAMMLASIAFFISLGVTIWVWQPTMKWNIDFKNSLPLPPSVSNPSMSSPVRYQSPFDYTPEVWNCLLAPYVVSPQSQRMNNLCNEAKVAKYMMIPVVLLSALLMIAVGLALRASSKAAAAETEMSNVKDVDEVSIESKDNDEKKDYN